MECPKSSTPNKDRNIPVQVGRTAQREKKSKYRWTLKDMQRTIFEYRASMNPSSTIIFTSILAIQVLNYLEDFIPISCIISRKKH